MVIASSVLATFLRTDLEVERSVMRTRPTWPAREEDSDLKARD